MERLTRKLSDGTAYTGAVIDASIADVNYPTYIGEAVDKLAAYEDAEEQGQILRLPISKDTPVYSIEYCCGRDKSNRIGMCVRGFCKDCDDKAYYIRESTANYCDICEIQKSVFFTFEEAEAKLKEMEGRHGGE